MFTFRSIAFKQYTDETERVLLRTIGKRGVTATEQSRLERGGLKNLVTNVGESVIRWRTVLDYPACDELDR